MLCLNLVWLCRILSVVVAAVAAAANYVSWRVLCEIMKIFFFSEVPY